ncbi:SLAP domain-containing protein [Lactobacillus helveticus]|nr:SLAP domain-containing protein [Lactobacillus helveticus]MCD9224267.1 SLAP domain-containing protein [Lactobacillus helveticus]
MIHNAYVYNYKGKRIKSSLSRCLAMIVFIHASI